MTTTKPLAPILIALGCLAMVHCGRSKQEGPRQDAGMDQASPATADSGLAAPADGRVPEAAADLGMSHDIGDGVSDARLADLASNRDSGPDGPVAQPDSATDRGATDGPVGPGDGLVSVGLDAGADAKLDTAVVPSPDGKRDVVLADSSGRCNDLVADGPIHDIVTVPGAAPTPLGGSIEDGLYYETKAEIFNVADGGAPLLSGQRRMTMLVDGGTLQVVYENIPSGDTSWETDQIDVEVPDAGPGSFSVRSVCPTAAVTAPFVFHYSFVGTGKGATLTIIYPSDLMTTGQSIVLTLVRQQ
jgi:hypothetical protein